MTKIHLLGAAALLVPAVLATPSQPTVRNANQQVTYAGVNRNGVEAFLGIKYGQDTSGEFRFKPPRLYVPKKDSTVNATQYGAACPQGLFGATDAVPFAMSAVDTISEDCLSLNIIRPQGLQKGARVPVLLFIYGGGFTSGQNKEVSNRPDGLVRESVANGVPVLHVAINYRLGVFGFAKSDALRAEGSENAAFRDQRLALEWVRDNIASFGGDPDNVAIHGQSSGGVSVGMHLMAYGGSKPALFRKAICQSGCVEQGITRNFTVDAMTAVVNEAGCTKNGLNSKETVACLRRLDTQTLLDAQLKTAISDTKHNAGDVWLPAIDGDFLPDKPSKLIQDKRFAKNVSVMIGWTEDELSWAYDASFSSEVQTRQGLADFLPDLSATSTTKLLSLYPASDFMANPEADMPAEAYRNARIFRDLIMVCGSVYYGRALAAANNDVYLYQWNQTVLAPLIKASWNETGRGAIHTSELAYTFGDFGNYDYKGQPLSTTDSDKQLLKRGSRSWSTFAATGKPSLAGRETLQGFKPAFQKGSDGFSLYVVGGPSDGWSAVDGKTASAALKAERLRERCEFINTPEMISVLGY